MIANVKLDLPDGLNPAHLFASTGEDKGDDVNVAIGVRYSLEEDERQQLFATLVAWLTAERCERLFDCQCTVVGFPTVAVVNVTAHGLLRRARYDKQGKSMGRRLLEYLHSRR